MKLSQIAIACPEIQAALKKLQILGFESEAEHEVPTEKVMTAMLPVEVSEHLKIELLEPTEKGSPISRFLETRTKGGIHHIAFEVDDLQAWYEKLKKNGIEVLPPGIRTAVRGKALFIHPKDMVGVLVELEEMA